MLLWPSGGLARDLVRYGLPVMLNELLWSVAISMHSVILGHMSSDIVAANSICNVMFQMATSIILGVSNASAVLVGMLVGRGDYPYARACVNKLIQIYAVIGVVCAALLLAVKGPVIGIYDIKESTRVLTDQLMYVYAAAIFFMAFTCPLISGVLRGAGDTRFAAVTDVGCIWAMVPLGAAAAFWLGATPVLVLAVLGLLLWLVYMGTPFVGKGAGKKEVTDWSFLKSTRFWLLTGLLFCQNAAEQSVTGWMVTYFKGSGIIAGTLAAYTVTVMWGATLVGRLLIAFVFPLKNPRKAMVGMSVLCTIFYVLLVMAHTQVMAIVLLFAFAFSMAGLNPTAVASAGRMTSVTSMGIMLPVASSGAILMPWVIGMVAERAGLAAGMASNIVPCVGLVVFTLLVARLPEE